jgi:hypothetical protein
VPYGQQPTESKQEAVEFVHDDNIEQMAFGSRIAQHLLERFALVEILDAE